MHQITHTHRILSPENGFLLGNGDLSVSVYQTETAIVWRFGKGNVWDRRLDLRDDPKPAHIDEVRRGILEEGWQVGTIGENLTALKGSKDEKRMREICQGSPKSYETRPYPCPKPVGELAMHLPPDLMNLDIRQTLSIEDGVVSIQCEQPGVFRLSLECWVDSRENILAVDWKAEDVPEQKYGHTPSIWFSLYRWADPRVEVFAARQYAKFRTGLVCGTNDPEKATPLPLPIAEEADGLWRIRQDFYPEKTYPQGSCCLMAPLSGEKTELPRWPLPDTAALHILPDEMAGCLTVGVTATGDLYGDTEGLTRLHELAGKPDFRETSRKNLAEDMKAYWSHSSFQCGEPLLENLWYENLYAFRCVYKKGTVPPGLFFPSTIGDYAHWHGDYHSNYNFQQPFWGICTSNHPEGLDSYFDGMEFFFRIGRKIARDYYSSRGVFVQLTAFPIDAEDDPIGVVPLGRMAYMTGWASSLYWYRYLCTLDKEWLNKTGYPAIRECALFFTDFLKLGPDGKYHAFPSNQGEEGFSGNPADFCDREEVADHLCYCLRSAIAAAEVLKTDEDLVSTWKNLLANYAADKAAAFPEGSLEQYRCAQNPPEFRANYLMERDLAKENTAWPAHGHYVHDWYFGHYPLIQIKRLYMGMSDTSLDYPRFLEEIRRWRHPNGLCWAMSVAHYGQIGAWTETLGVLGPLTEYILQSWDGCLRLFAGIPENVDLSFQNFRARGAFLVSASRKNGVVEQFSVFSEKGDDCSFVSPWPSAQILDEEGKNIEVFQDSWGRETFHTAPGILYELKPGQ